MNEYREKLIKDMRNQQCPICKSKNIGVDNWGMFYEEKDWFYYCKECDNTFNAGDKAEDVEICVNCNRYEYCKNDNEGFFSSYGWCEEYNDEEED